MSNEEFKAKFGVPDDAALLKLDLKAGDILAIVLPEDAELDQEQLGKIEKQVQAHLGVKVLVCPYGAELKVVRPC